MDIDPSRTFVSNERKSGKLRSFDWRKMQGGVIFVVSVTLYAVIHWWPAQWTPYKVFGLILLFGAETLWATARLQLGRSFTARAEARSLVTHGIYARLQNPIYLFGSLALAGLFCFLEWRWALLLLAVSIPIQILRIRRERTVLSQAFGPQYEEYRRKTWF
jgi:protein-S-isoprenylcysteine O-methyltransferase Ste14